MKLLQDRDRVYKTFLTRVVSIFVLHVLESSDIANIDFIFLIGLLLICRLFGNTIVMTCSQIIFLPGLIIHLVQSRNPMWMITFLLEHNADEFIAVVFYVYNCHPLILFLHPFLCYQVYLKTLVGFNELVENEALYRKHLLESIWK